MNKIKRTLSKRNKRITSFDERVFLLAGVTCDIGYETLYTGKIILFALHRAIFTRGKQPIKDNLGL